MLSRSAVLVVVLTLFLMLVHGTAPSRTLVSRSMDSPGG